MNADKSFPSPRLDDAHFDRLVDGELSADEFRALLATLDDEPGGWRRCALAFLENQALAGELSGLRDSLDFEDPGAGGAPGHSDGRGDLTPPRRTSPRDLGTMLAIAASFLLTFALGVAAPQFFVAGPQDGTSAGNLKRQSPLAARSQSPLAANGNQPAATDGRHQTFRPIGGLRLVMDGAGDETPQAGRVPVYEVDGGLEQFLKDDRPALSPDLVRMLQQRGHDVQHQQQYIPVQLDDGRQVVVPVEGYQITPVGRRVY